MDLQEKLDARKKEFESSAPADAVEVMHRATRELEQSGLADRARGKGDPAPDFSLKNVHGDLFELKPRVAETPVVLGFYRGRW